MRTRLAALASVIALAFLAVGCTGAAAPPDPYEQLANSAKVGWNPIQINVGLTVTAQGTTVKLDPADMALVMDVAGGKGAFHFSLPAAGLGIPASALTQLGVTGDSLDFDMVYAGDALYARSPVFKSSLSLLLGPAGKLPKGDLTGWLKLATKEELAALEALSGAAAGQPSFAPPSAGDGGMKASLEMVGVTLTTVGTEKHNGADAQHLKIAVDMSKLANNPEFLASAGPQAAAVAASMKAVTVSGDLWIDPATNRVVEFDSHVVLTGDPTNVADITVTARDPDGSVSLEAPSSSIEIPLSTLISQAMKLLSKGAES